MVAVPICDSFHWHFFCYNKGFGRIHIPWCGHLTMTGCLLPQAVSGIVEDLPLQPRGGKERTFEDMNNGFECGSPDCQPSCNGREHCVLTAPAVISTHWHIMCVLWHHDVLGSIKWKTSLILTCCFVFRFIAFRTCWLPRIMTARQCAQENIYSVSPGGCLQNPSKYQIRIRIFFWLVWGGTKSHRVRDGIGTSFADCSASCFTIYIPLGQRLITGFVHQAILYWW